MTQLGRPERVVFDCPVYAQALINPTGPAAECLRACQNRRLLLFISSYVIQEIRELPGKVKSRLGVTQGRVEALVQDLIKYAELVEHVPDVYSHPIDPDDSHYINLAAVTDSRLIVSRDRHLLNLMDTGRPEGQDFQRLFPDLIILPPDRLANELRAARA